MAHQYIEQLDERVKPAVFGNVGTIIVFRVGAADAEELVREFTPVFTEEDIVNLPKYEMYLKLMIDGIASDPFSAIGLPPLPGEEMTNNIEKVISYSRQKYATKKDIVEEKIMRWHQEDKDDEKKSAPKFIRAEGAPTSSAGEKKAKITVNNGFMSICSSCGVTVNTPFKPDGVRPVYCKKCLNIKPAERKAKTEPKSFVRKESLDNSQNSKRNKNNVTSNNFKKDDGTDNAKDEVLALTLEELKKTQPVSFYKQKNKIDNAGQNKNIVEKNIEEGEDVVIEN
mgnify:CR=1 FL=1